MTDLKRNALKNISDRQLLLLIKPSLFILCLLPFILLLIAALTDGLGTNPVETLTHDTGQWALRLLLLTLAVTPLRRLTKLNWLIKLRRMLGLFTFFYALLHLITYIWLDQFFDWSEILLDIPKRPFITIGFISFVLLLPLALTSTKAMQRRLKKRWLTLHKLVYVIPLLVVIHFTWSLKADYSEPFLYASIFIILMLARILYSRKKAPQF
ncbi:MAG: sulfoxide reductase heme-binding subunit YedZ [Gammaproteobacteria bacterium]|nr:sulfoxide reductase heme-binding subunit YedZ [Gammaproteobacteria bacterium]MBT8134230.1 sulfoxide reductase heme-binding subunit YedZ [Gammaproteobacteria bacterium]NNJ49073.1 sulfoxide reductase heme-binding subunit YedZ [Gammaproteobacteria bacterium]